MEEPEPPPLGWTMREAVEALLPDLLAAADGQPPQGWWMAGGAEYKANEREALHRAFARIMEAGLFHATGMVKGQEQPIAPALWRAAKFGLGLQRDRVDRDFLLAGGQRFQGVRVNRLALDSRGGTRPAAGSGGIGEGQAPGVGAFWWSACEAYTWVAFGEARKLCWKDDDGIEHWADSIEFPQAEWSRDWKHWPPFGLSKAFVVTSTGQEWVPDDESDWQGPGEAILLARARFIISETGDSPERLNELLAADVQRCIRNQGKLRQAFREVMAAVRAGRLTVRARRALPNGRPDIDAGHEELDACRWFLGPRAISLSGGVEYTGASSEPLMAQTSLEAMFDYHGPRWDDAHFIAAQVRELRQGTEKAVEAPRSPASKHQVKGLNYEAADAPLVQQALAGMKTGIYNNATDAARALARNAKGAGNEESRMKRLLRRIQPHSVSE